MQQRDSLHHPAAGRDHGPATVLDAVRHEVDGMDGATLFLAAGSDARALYPGAGVTLASQNSVGGALCLTFRIEHGAGPYFLLGGARIDLTWSPVETQLFEGLNTMAAVRNGETASTVAAWLNHHVQLQSLQGAVVVDRAPPVDDTEFAENLDRAMDELGLKVPVLVLRSSVPLGKADMPAEAHPYCVPEAPGKDRMKVPPPAPWRSPLGAMSLYEILRLRFLSSARAVANLEVHDLLPDGARNVFDSAVEAEGGVIALFGRHCYPWRVRKDQDAQFAGGLQYLLSLLAARLVVTLDRYCTHVFQALQVKLRIFKAVGFGAVSGYVGAIQDGAGTVYPWRHQLTRLL